MSQLAHQRSTRFAHLYWGGRTQRDLYDLAAMRHLCESHSGLRLVPCVSDEPPSGDVAGGTAVDVALREADWRDHEVYVCGSPEMVRATRDRLLAAGIPRDQVHLEAFGNQETAT
jgi:NAD(P)H-flavin reductase